ncbi:MAG TPA: proton-conducting transporter membrane subunit [Ktedonobacteraceae bacterium]|nr:proton-conducting transporter membrane subunit [Ktedonobacteraceae bacterium]
MDWNQLPGFAFWAMFVLFLLGALLSLVLQKARITTITAAVCAGLGSIAAIVAGIGVLSGTPAPVGMLETNLPFGAFTLKLDMLSAFFLVVIGLVALPIALYSVGYLSHHSGKRVMAFAVLLNLLLLSLVLIVAASDMIVFLMAWEAMAFLSYMMINFDYEDPSVIRSGYVMLAISEIGTVGILIAFLLLYQAAGSFDFGALRVAATTLSLPVRSAVFLLVLVGFGAKIGVLPLQLWMPDAYHAAPGHAAALLSAVVINLGVYGIVRFLLDFMGGHEAMPLWWGLLVLLVGATTALVGILYSVIQRDLKRVLAYSSVENMGIILTAVGATLTFRSYHLTALAAIAVIVALYHMLNHSVYKALLFMGAGSVQRATGTSEMGKLGGLVRLMPWTTFFFIVAALAIAAVPPFNGYISEWMLLETLLQSFAIPDTLPKVLMAVSGGMIALTAGIAVTAFVRACGVAFLALPRSKEATVAHESPLSMRIAMGLLAFCCLALGVLPTFVITVLDRVTTPFIGQSVVNQVVPPLFTNNPGAYQLLDTIGGNLFTGLPVNGLVVIAAPNFSTIDSPSYLLLAELLLVGLLLLVLKLIRPLGKKRRGRVWAGGIPRFAAMMTYTELAYSNPIRIIFNGLFRSQTSTGATASAARHGEGDISYQQEVPPPFERFLYRPIVRAWEYVTHGARIIQSGNINQYIFYIFLIVLIALILRAL